MKILYLGILFFISISFVNCGNTTASIKLSLDSNVIFNCENSTISKLSPVNGGFSFSCMGKSVYFIYDTSTAKDGTVKVITINKRGSTSLDLLPAIHSTKRGNFECDSAKVLNRISGETPFKQDMFGYPLYGTYQMEIARPCGKLTIVLDRIKL